MPIDPYADPFIASWVSRGEAKGEAGEAKKNLLRVLDARRLGASDLARDLVGSCTDLELLELWIERAATANSIDTVFAGYTDWTAEGPSITAA